MNTTLLHRRRIERYAQLLDEANGDRPSSHARSSKDTELNDLVTFGNQISLARPDVTMDVDKRAEIRAFLMATAERDGIGATAKAVAEPVVGRARVGVAKARVRGSVVGKAGTVGKAGAAGRAGTVVGRAGVVVGRAGVVAGKVGAGKAGSSVRTRARARGAILVGLAVGTLALSGISAASGSALPGDTLYGVKRSQENAQLALAGSSVAKGRLYLAFAGVRASEAQAVRTNSGELNGVLNTMDSETLSGARLLLSDALAKPANGSDSGSLASVRQFATNQTSTLNNLLTAMSAQDADRGRVLTSIGLLGRVQERAYSIQLANNCGSTATATSDKYGPMPAACPESAIVTPTPTHSTGGTGKASPSSRKPGQAPATGAAPLSAGTTSTGSTPAGSTGAQNLPATGLGDAAGDVSAAPSPTTTDDGGLLGSIGHVLGGLLGR